MSISKSVQRNPFWDIIKQETPKYGFRYEVKQGKNHHDVIIFGLHNGQQSSLRFPFPRVCNTFDAVPNFKSKFIKFVRDYTREIGFTSPDVRFQAPPERKSTYIQKLNLDKPKKQLVPPKTMLVAAASNEMDVIAPPTMPTTYVGERAKRDPNEPVSDSKVLAVFLVDLRDLSTMIEVCEGVAKFRTSKPAPLRILGPTQPAAPEAPVAAPSPPTNVVQLSSIPKVEGSKQAKIINRVNENPEKIWQPNDFTDIMQLRSLTSTLSLLTSSKKLRRVARGQYMARI